MSKCCIHANFDNNPVIRSGYIEHMLKVHASSSADTNAEGILIRVYASKSNLCVAYMSHHKVYFPFVAQMREKKIQNL